ncbi:hypothetical protein OG800_49500 (plasmid) [Streptomyces sp. NBC_00445]|uniref:hypothetical protein n=1 Tax=Streptomyces sp. NBC_00445 TaxID=2975745 RepID=UPI002E223B4B
MGVPAIPQMCAHRPRRGGLVVPYVSFEHNDAVAFGALDPRKRTRAFNSRLCQVCERPLHERFYVLVRPQDVSAGYAPEPGLHPPCLLYSERACPMLAGSAATYRQGGVITRHPAGRACDDPDCSCPVTAPSQEDDRRSGSEADDWDAWMLPLTDYRLRSSGGEPVGIDLPSRPLRIRRVRVSPARERALALIAALQELDL